jgi:hypothetical protein
MDQVKINQVAVVVAVQVAHHKHNRKYNNNNQNLIQVNKITKRKINHLTLTQTRKRKIRNWIIRRRVSHQILTLKRKRKIKVMNHLVHQVHLHHLVAVVLIVTKRKKILKKEVKRELLKRKDSNHLQRKRRSQSQVHPVQVAHPVIAHHQVPVVQAHRVAVVRKRLEEKRNNQAH